MANRDVKRQGLHDRIIVDPKFNFDLAKYDVFYNPNGEKNAAIKGLYPDIVITDKGSTNVSFIIEVETDDSITDDEAKNQWQKYSSEINAIFWLFVPRNMKSQASILIVKYGINAYIGTYVAENDLITDIKFE